METLFQAQPLTHNHQTNISVSPVPEPQPASQNLHASLQPFAAGTKPHLLYKCLLNQHAQKLRKPIPVYHTQNEGSDHLPRFRSTVFIDGTSYTSSTTFQQRKMAEMDASKAAYIAIIHKLKSDALLFIREDKIFSKSILAEYGAKLNIGKPTYETSQLGMSAPVFRSSVLISGVSYVGDIAKSKKEAEQVAARAAILSYIDSESGTDMAEIIYYKSRQFAELNKIQEVNLGHNITNVLETQTGVGNALTLTVGKPESGTSTMAKSSAVPEPVLVIATSAVPEPVLVNATTVPATFLSSGVTPSTFPQTLIEPITLAAPAVTELPIPINPAVPVSSVLAETPYAEVKNSSSTFTMVSAPLVNVPATDISSVVIQPAHSNMAAQTLEYIPLMGQSSERKRNRKNKKNTQKKMRVDTEMPLVPASQVPSSSS